jgi:hypothetical protein
VALIPSARRLPALVFFFALAVGAAGDSRAENCGTRIDPSDSRAFEITPVSWETAEELHRLGTAVELEFGDGTRRIGKFSLDSNSRAMFLESGLVDFRIHHESQLVLMGVLLSSIRVIRDLNYAFPSALWASISKGSRIRVTLKDGRVLTGKTTDGTSSIVETLGDIGIPFRVLGPHGRILDQVYFHLRDIASSELE